MPGIMDFFRGAPSPAAPAAQATNNGLPPQGIPGTNPAPQQAAQTPNTAANGTVPNNTNTPTNSSPENNGAAASPLAEFGKLWESNPTPNGKGSDQMFNIDPAKLRAAAGQVDFVKNINPELFQAIEAGGAGASKALGEILNLAVQDVYAQSAMSTTKIVEAALQKQSASQDERIAALVKKNTVSDSLRNKNPAFSDPAVQPIIKALEAQLTTKFPDATTSDLQDMAVRYLESVGATFAAKPAVDTTKASNKTDEVDWDVFLRGSVG